MAPSISSSQPSHHLYLPPKVEKDNSKFLHSILKQISTKGVNWEQVVQENDIPSAGAAPTRWHRYQVSMSPDGKIPPKKKAEEGAEGGGEGKKNSKEPRKRKAVEMVERGWRWGEVVEK